MASEAAEKWWKKVQEDVTGKPPLRMPEIYGTCFDAGAASQTEKLECGHPRECWIERKLELSTAIVDRGYCAWCADVRTLKPTTPKVEEK